MSKIYSNGKYSPLLTHMMNKQRVELAQSSEPAPAQDSQPVGYFDVGVNDDVGAMRYLVHNGEPLRSGDMLYTSPQSQPSESEAVKLLREMQDDGVKGIYWRDRIDALLSKVQSVPETLLSDDDVKNLQCATVRSIEAAVLAKVRA